MAMHVEQHHKLETLQRLARQQRDGRMRVRYQAIVLAKQDRTASQIAEALGYSRKSVHNWIRRYNEDGLDGLQDREGRGRTAKLTSKQQKELSSWLEQEIKKHGTRALKGQEIQDLLREKYDVAYSLSGVYELLHRFGFYASGVARPPAGKRTEQ